jgi:uncharacterized protein (TIGR00290 family)
MNGVPVTSSWSSGKASCLALYRCVRNGAVAVVLSTMFDERGERSRSHGLRPEVLAAQAERVGVPLRTGRASWQTHETRFKEQLSSLHDERVLDIVFGDIDLPPHRKWEERVCTESDVRPNLPLWLADRQAILEEFWAAGFRCRIIVVDAARVSGDVLGAELKHELAAVFVAQGIDACGENGEFHTVVVDRPLFRRPLDLDFGEVVASAGCLAIEARIRGSGHGT